MSFHSKSLPPPTADEQARMEAIKLRSPCVVCGDWPCEVHHLLSGGGLRLGHRYTVGLCASCHSQVKTRTFKTHYPDQWMLDRQDNLLGWPNVLLPKSRARTGRSPTERPAKILPRQP